MKIFQAVAVISAVLLMFIFTPACQTADKGDINVAEKCPELEMKKVDAIVKKVVPDGNTVDIKESPVKGVWEIGVESKGQRGSIFLDCSGKYLIQLTQLDAYLAQIQAQQTPQKVDISKIPLGDSITVGAKKAAKKVIVFTGRFRTALKRSSPSGPILHLSRSFIPCRCTRMLPRKSSPFCARNRLRCSRTLSRER